MNEHIWAKKRELEEKFKQEKLKWRASEFYKIFKMATADNSKIKAKEKEIKKSLRKRQTKL